MDSLLSISYIVPAVFLNPILLLHSFNTILSRLLPPISIDAPVQPAPSYPLGPSARHPHLNIHTSDRLCWSYTVVIVCAQLLIFGRVKMKQERMKERLRRKTQGAPLKCSLNHAEYESIVNGSLKNDDSNQTLYVNGSRSTFVQHIQTSSEGGDEND